ncbi:hypothetical protein PYW08_008548 [Mythimna loreyi]|uniref:Uncharacterized protein n=1 Tax=Mythimna loreyi TaxID=667449 RepID=A0ACC2QAN8_9NEOP|nr:hypothetical protein PYW08_008548 [Mythimna loreyi]
MPGKIKVKVLAGRNLPVMDRASDTTDAFVEIKFGSITHKTDVCRKSLNPHWNNTEWYRFEVDESELQDEPLQLRLMDHDTYSANDAIGKVVISLAPLLAREANNAKSTATPHGGAVMSGWIPVFDTMHGIRGELNVIVKVELFSDFNKYKTSSCGVQFFHCPMIPPGYRATSIHGFVEELVVNDDPEYQWIDKIRTPRASNEARQVAFIKLSNQVQRLVGLKAAELGANAVVGYQQDFDLEGEAGVVARAIGTAVSITPLPMPSQTMNMPPCTQQQLKKYLDILATDNESISEMSSYYQSHQEELQKLLLILNPNASSLLDETDALEEDEKSMDMTRQSSITSYAGSVSIYQDDLPHRRSLRHLSEDQTDLNRLLNRDSDDSDSSGPIEKLKKIKTNFFTKRFTKRPRSKRSSVDKQEDTISLRSNTSDTSRISLVDIKNELKKFKGLRKPKFRKPFVNKEEEGEGMASILARSIIHVQTGLACIAETQDSEASPCSTIRRASESEPIIICEDDDAKANKEPETEDAKTMQDIHYTSLNNINTEEVKTMPQRERKISESCPATPMPDRSENLLTLPGEAGYFGSVSSALSAESSELESSSEEEDDDDSSDLKTDNERSIETTSSVVQSVLSHELNPQLIASMDKKLNMLGSGSQPDLKEAKHEDSNKEIKPMEIKKEIDKKAVVEQQVFDTQVLIDKSKSLECVPRETETEIVVEKPVHSNEALTSSVKDDTSERDRDRREDKYDKDRGSPSRHARHESYGGREPVQTTHAQNSSLNATSTPLGIHRRSSDSDLSVTPKGGSLNTSAGNVGSGGGAILRPSMNSNNLDMLEYPFLTMTEYPHGFIVHIGGTVCARSVKLADGGEGAARAAWWAELRTELRAHARALRCNAVIAYTENTAICEDVCVLSASGTAAVINLDCDFNADLEPSTATTGSKNAIDDVETDSCNMAHVPYSPGSGPYRAELSTCGGCRRSRVPAVLLATCAKPNKLTSYAKAVTLTAVAARVRRAPPTSEPGARDISDQLPFLEYELHKLLLAKLRMQGANALFSLQTQISIGERCVMALASGTACRLAALPPPAPPRIKASENDKDALEIQKALWDSFSANRAANGFDIGGTEHATNGALPEVEGEELPALDLCADKDACVLELDETEDVETARALAKRHVNMQVYTHALKPVLGAPPQAFAQVWRGRLVLSGGAGSSAVERHVRRALDGVAYKLRRLQPCALVAPRFQLELPEDEIQLIVSGSAIPLQDPNTPESNGVENGTHSSSQHSSQTSNAGSSQGSQGNGDADDDIFTLDEEQLVKSTPEVVEDKGFVSGQVPTTVSLTTLSHISGSRVSRRLCALRLLFLRETTAVRELGGLSGFLHTFTCEVMAIVRAYTAALGGNALTSFYITQLMLQDNAHKNQGQCLLSVGGDIVHITY